jgi:antitoxin FitA
MSKMIQIRDVPDSLHRLLKSRAANEGMTLSDFLKRELQHTAERPTIREWLERTRQAKPIPTKRTAAQVIRELREEQAR